MDTFNNSPQSDDCQVNTCQGEGFLKIVRSINNQREGSSDYFSRQSRHFRFHRLHLLQTSTNQTDTDETGGFTRKPKKAIYLQKVKPVKPKSVHYMLIKM